MNLEDGLSEIDQYAIRNIQCRVRGLVGRYGITAQDRDDLIQQLFLEYLERIGRFDPERGSYKTFVNCLIRNQAISIVRVRKRQLREATLCALASTPAEDPDDETHAAGSTEINQDVVAMATGRASRPAAELLHLRIDVYHAVNSLPPHLRDIGDRVVAEGVTDVSQALGRSETRIYQLLWKIRAAFTEFGVVPAAGDAR
jgi:RNA polymerase sigma-70 factor, ECF subfamily